MALPQCSSSSTVSSRCYWNLEMLVFIEGGKPENLQKNPHARTRTNNKLNAHMTPGLAVELGPLSPLLSPPAPRGILSQGGTLSIHDGGGGGGGVQWGRILQTQKNT